MGKMVDLVFRQDRHRGAVRGCAIIHIARQRARIVIYSGRCPYFEQHVEGCIFHEMMHEILFRIAGVEATHTYDTVCEGIEKSLGLACSGMYVQGGPDPHISPCRLYPGYFTFAWFKTSEKIICRDRRR